MICMAPFRCFAVHHCSYWTSTTTHSMGPSTTSSTRFPNSRFWNLRFCIPTNSTSRILGVFCTACSCPLRTSPPSRCTATTSSAAPFPAFHRLSVCRICKFWRLRNRTSEESCPQIWCSHTARSHSFCMITGCRALSRWAWPRQTAHPRS